MTLYILLASLTYAKVQQLSRSSASVTHNETFIYVGEDRVSHTLNTGSAPKYLPRCGRQRRVYIFILRYPNFVSMS